MNQRGHSDTDVFFGLLLIVLSVGGAVWFIGWGFLGWNPFSGERIAYSAYCKGEIDNGQCNGHIVLVGPDVYTALPEGQMVIYQTLEKASPPVKFDECTVRDKKNWKCRTPLIIEWLEMVDGDMKYGHDKIRDVPKWKWWLCKLSIVSCEDLWRVKRRPLDPRSLPP
jgi:hypothetical protein